MQDFMNDTQAYIRKIAPDLLPKDMREKLPKGRPVFALHDAQGKCLALLPEEKVARAVAVRNDLEPVALH